jgi:hypothetical protein
MPGEKPWLSSLTFVGFLVNSAIAKGHGDAISFDEIYGNLESGTLLQFLEQKIPGEFDFSLMPPGSEQCIAVNHVLHDASAGFQGRERRKSGVETSGLHLLVAFILEAIQRRDWVLENRA